MGPRFVTRATPGARPIRGDIQHSQPSRLHSTICKRDSLRLPMSSDPLTPRFVSSTGRGGKNLPPRPQPPVCVPAAGRGRRLFLCEKARTRDARTQFLLAHRHGEIDLIGGHKGVLCFVVIKSRTTREVKPAEAAVDGYKRQELFACRPRNTCATCHLRARGASKLLACSQMYRPLKCSRMFPSWRKMSLFASFCGKDFSNCLNLEKTQS